jgi:hypothetical protein
LTDIGSQPDNFYEPKKVTFCHWVEVLFVQTNRDIQIDIHQNITKSLEVLLDLVRNIAGITCGGNKNSRSIGFAQ